MELRANAAAALYSAARPATKPTETEKLPGGGFEKIVTDLTQTLQNGENTAKDALTGNADLPSLVEALASSELAVEMAVTIRNKVVEAYQEILRMPV